MSHTVQAQWHLGDLDAADDVDPLTFIAMLQETDPLDVTREPEAITEDIRMNVLRINRLWETGVRCELLTQADHACHGCEHRVTDTSDAQAAVCMRGIRLEELTQELEGVRSVEGLDSEMVAAFLRDAEACEEIAEAVLG
jgi:hypothetical protein